MLANQTTGIQLSDTQCDFGRPAPLIILRKTSFNGRWSAGVDPSLSSLTSLSQSDNLSTHNRQALMIQKFRPLCFRRLWSTVAGCNLVSAGGERWFCVYSGVEKPTMPIQISEIDNKSPWKPSKVLSQLEYVIQPDGSWILNLKNLPENTQLCCWPLATEVAKRQGMTYTS